MTRFSGLIGIARGPEESDSNPGVYEEVIVELRVTGGQMRRDPGARYSNMKANKPRAKHILSIIPPESSTVDINEVVYIWWKGRKWSVIDIGYEHPRVLLTLGGLYNG